MIENKEVNVSYKTFITFDTSDKEIVEVDNTMTENNTKYVRNIHEIYHEDCNSIDQSPTKTNEVTKKKICHQEF